MLGFNIILINGLIGSGKDTLGDILVKHRGYKKISLAGTLKKDTSKKYGFGEALCHTQQGKKTLIEREGKTVRELLIIESEAAKLLDSGVFADKCVKEILSQDCKNIVISDFRFPQEYSRISSVFGGSVKTVKVIRPGVVAENLDSEHALDTFFFDAKILNDSTLENFTEKVINEEFF